MANSPTRATRAEKDIIRRSHVAGFFGLDLEVFFGIA
jgi:hypothetical protein